MNGMVGVLAVVQGSRVGLDLVSPINGKKEGSVAMRLRGYRIWDLLLKTSGGFL